MRPTIILILLSSLTVPSAAWAVSTKAASEVKQGIAQFQAGDYTAAAESFAEAAKAEPDDSRVAFDQACAHAAAGNEADAIHWFQKAALSEDTALAARCHYNMGCIDVDKAKDLLAGKHTAPAPEEVAPDETPPDDMADPSAPPEEDAAPKQPALKPTTPEEAAPAVRQEAIQLLEVAIAHFRDATELNPQDADARHNIETARLWIDYISDVWRQRDAQAARDRAQLLEYLKTLDQQQRTLRLGSKGLSKVRKSLRQRQGVFETARIQGYLTEEIDPLKAKVQAAVRKPPAVRPGTQPGQMGQPGQPPMPGMPAGQPGCGSGCQTGCQPGSQPSCGSGGCQSQVAPQADPEKAMKVLGGLADNAGKAMTAAKEELDAGAPRIAVKIQAEAIEKLDEIYTVLAPYVPLVKAAVDKQQALVGESTQAVANEKAENEPKPEPKEEEKPESTEDPTAQPEESAIEQPLAMPTPPPAAARPPVDLEESAWNQPFITRYSEVIRAKAQQGLKNMPPPPPKKEEPKEEDKPSDDDAMASAAPTPGAPQAQPPATMPGKKPEEMDPAAAMKKQQEEALKKQEALRKAMENAVKYCPEVRTLTLEATDHIEDGEPELALPKQEKALELLKKMLPEDDNKDKDKDQDKDKDKDKQDENKDQDKDDKKDQQKDQQDKKDQEQDKKEQEQKQQPKPQDLSKQQAEAVLRKARQREKEKKEMEKAMQIYLYRPGEVEKDW